MTAIERALESGEYREAPSNILRFPLRYHDPAEGLEASKRFLLRIISRAVLDVCMYGEDNENHVTARDWLLGNHEAEVAFVELAELVDIDSISATIEAMAEAEGVHRDKIREVKRQLYNWSEDGSN